MSDDDRISKPTPSRFPMPDDIDFAQMYQHTIKPLDLSEEQKKSLSDEEYAQSVPVYHAKRKAVSIRTEIDFSVIDNPLEMTEESKTDADDFYRDALHQAVADEMKKWSKPTTIHYREPATSNSSRFGSTDAFILDSTPIQFDGPLESYGFVRGILLRIDNGTTSDLVFCTLETSLRYREENSTNPRYAFLASSVVLTPCTATLQGGPLSYFSNTDDKVLEIAFQLDFCIEPDTGNVWGISLAYFHGHMPKIPTTVAIIAVDLCMFKKQENDVTENQNSYMADSTADDNPVACINGHTQLRTDEMKIVSEGAIGAISTTAQREIDYDRLIFDDGATSGSAEEVATINGHLQLHPDDVTIVNDGVNSAIASFTVPDDMTNHFRLKPAINELRFEKMYPDVKIPQKQTSGSAGMDVHAYLSESVVIPPGERRLIPTGLKTCFPDWMELQVRSRSGLALKHGIIVLNAPGTIDADYPGELGVILYNTSMTPYLVQHDARIAQLVPAQVLSIPVVEGVREEETTRTSSGFGSTGV